MNLKTKTMLRDLSLEGILWFSIGALFAKKWGYIIIIILYCSYRLLEHNIKKEEG